MPVLTAPAIIAALLRDQSARSPDTVPAEVLEPALEKLSALSNDLSSLNKSLQDAADANDAFAMVMLLMDAAYDHNLDACKLRNLLSPLRDKLDRAIEEMRLVM